MPDRLSALDASFLYVEDATTPMHAGSVAVFRKPRSGFDYERFVELIERRLPLVPRYRQKVAGVPGRLARPVWIDDTGFDLTHHVRRCALPKPGNTEQLRELVARLMSRPLDKTRPLWEAYLVEGLARGHVALILKTHQALVDGVRTIDIGQVILDNTPHVHEPPDEPWLPRVAPSQTRLVLDAMAETVQRPREIMTSVCAVAGDVIAAVQRLSASVGGPSVRPAPHGPLNVPITNQRRVGMARVRLTDVRGIRAAHGGTVNDVVLALVAGALRSWLLSRGVLVTTSSRIRALVPLAVRDEEVDDAVPGMLGNKVAPYLVDLPVGEPNPVVRLQRIRHGMHAHNDSVRSVAAAALLRVGGFAPPTLHSLGARAANSFSKRIFNLVVTNVPGPQQPLYAGPARMTEMYPVLPLVRNQALAIGVTSYDGGVYFGLNGDREAMSDVDVLARMLEESVEELSTVVRA